MADVIFNEEPQVLPMVAPLTRKTPLFPRTIIGIGLAKTEAQANVVLVILSIALLVSAVVVNVLLTPKSHVMTAQEKASLLRMQNAGSSFR